MLDVGTVVAGPRQEVEPQSRRRVACPTIDGGIGAVQYRVARAVVAGAQGREQSARPQECASVITDFILIGLL